jgi:hypothetical protein
VQAADHEGIHLALLDERVTDDLLAGVVHQAAVKR